MIRKVAPLLVVLLASGAALADTAEPVPCASGGLDVDGDGLCWPHDNCLDTYNPGQEDRDGDGAGDACDACPDDPYDRDDGDDICAPPDNCPTEYNPEQADGDGDGLGDACDACPTSTDLDDDGVCDDVDPCFGNNAWGDHDGDRICGDIDLCWGNDGYGDTDGDGLCDDLDPCPAVTGIDDDGDNVCGEEDNCPEDYNPGQVDSDGDGLGDACDPDAPTCPPELGGDTDADGICDDLDNCPDHPNPAQDDLDADGLGEPCDPCWGLVDTDVDFDGVCDDWDACFGDDADGDADGDGICADLDVCPSGDDRVDTDLDGTPDACDPCPLDASGDSDLDGVCDSQDVCPGGNDAGDFDRDGLPDRCDACPALPADFEVEDDLGSAVGNFTGDTCAGADWLDPSCTPQTFAKELVYAWAPPTAAAYTVSVVGYDSVVSLRDDGPCAGAELACNDDGGGLPGFGSQLVVTQPAGTPLLLHVDGYRDRCGPFTLTIACASDLDGDGGCDEDDACPLDPDDDLDGDGVCGDLDLCPASDDPDQADTDGDGLGDACDACVGDNATGDADGDGLCDGLDFVVELGPIVPGDPLVVTARRAPPFTRVTFLANLTGPGSGPCSPVPGVCADLRKPFMLTHTVSDPHGTATTSVAVPLSAPVGRKLWVQAVWYVAPDQADTSTVTSGTILARP